jgi:hypothetical protein
MARELSEFDLSPELQEAIAARVKAKMAAACRVLVEVVRAVEKTYGPEGKEVCRRAIVAKDRPPRAAGNPQDDLAEFLHGLEAACAVSHEWERVVDEPERVEYRFTRCMWAEIFREMNAPDIGFWFCEVDEPVLKAFSPRLGFERTQTLMLDDKPCDHAYFVRDAAAEPPPAF